MRFFKIKLLSLIQSCAEFFLQVRFFDFPGSGHRQSVEDFNMPDGITVRYTIGRAVDADGNIHIEGRGVVPTVRVPFTEEALFSEGDPELDAAIAALGSR